MPSQAQAVFKFVVTYGPRIGAALATLVDFLNKNPGIPTAMRKRLLEITTRVGPVARKRGAAKITGMLDIIRDVASEADSREGDSRVDANTWVSHADSIGHRVRLATALPKVDQKKKLALLTTETETLLAGLIDALAHVGPTLQAEPPASELRTL